MQSAFVPSATLFRQRSQTRLSCRRRPKWSANADGGLGETSWDNSPSYKSMGSGNPSKGLQQIEFIIRQDGSVVEKVTGVRGSSCEKVTERIEEALGKVVHSENTEDFYEQPLGNAVEENIDTESVYWPGADNLPTW